MKEQEDNLRKKSLVPENFVPLDALLGHVASYNPTQRRKFMLSRGFYEYETSENGVVWARRKPKKSLSKDRI